MKYVQVCIENKNALKIGQNEININNLEHLKIKKENTTTSIFYFI